MSNYHQNCLKLLFFTQLGPIRPGSIVEPLWERIPFEIYERFWFFNVTNPRDVENFGAKPALEEIGPFTYRLVFNKTDVIFNQNGTVSYREKKTWHFDPSKSVANESEIITTINGPVALALAKFQNFSPAVRVLLTLAIERLNENYFIRKSIREILFEGYPSLLITLAPLLDPNISKFSHGRFAWFVGKNDTDEGMYNMFTGTAKNGSILDQGLIDRFQNSTVLEYYKPGCNSLRDSSAGELWPPTDSPSIKFFFPDLCRPVRMYYNHTYSSGEVYDIYARRYVVDPRAFQSPADNPENSCYSPTELPSGCFSLSDCKFGAPMVASLPHFLHGDPQLARDVTGLSPNISQHELYIDVEPLLGLTVHLAGRMQVNVKIETANFGKYKRVPKIVLPVFWQEMSVKISSNYGNLLWLVTRLPDFMSIIFAGLAAIIGTAMFSSGLYRFVRNRQFSDSDKQMAQLLITDDINDDNSNSIE